MFKFDFFFPEKSKSGKGRETGQNGERKGDRPKWEKEEWGEEDSKKKKKEGKSKDREKIVELEESVKYGIKRMENELKIESN